MGYINADTLKRHKIITHYPGDYQNGWNDAIEEILEDERADVEEVKHGKWIKKRYQIYECSRCKRSVYLEGLNVTDENEAKLLKELYPYCHCGAKMDRKDE